MKRIAWLGPLLATLACGSNPSVIPAGDFSGPSGLAIAPLADRDLLFVANQGSNELRAIMLCTAAAGAPTTCSQQDDQHFLPAPIRLFPGSISVDKRPLRLAGAPVTDASGVPHGAVLVAGSDNMLRVLDATSIFNASVDKSVKAAPAKILDLPDVPIDVVATDVAGTSVTAIVATQPPTGISGALTVLTLTLDANGLVATPQVTGQCALDFQPTRLALVPGDAAPKLVYVADGTPDGTPGGVGDGAVEVSVPDIPAGTATPIPACPVTRRLPASDPADSPRLARPLRSIALNPAFTFAPPPPTPDAPPPAPQSFAPGALLIGATTQDKALCANHGVPVCPPELNVPAGTVCADHGTRSCGRGRVILLLTNVGGQSALVAAPTIPTPPLLPSSGAPMVPLSPPAPAREVAFQISGLRLFNTTAQSVLQTPPLLGLVAAEDGGTYFLDVVNRRFFNDIRDTATDLPVPILGSFTLTPAPTTGLPTLTLAPVAPNQPNKLEPGWVQTGVTRSGQWRVIWHGVMPGLESLSGALSRAAGSPTLSLRLAKSLAPWTSAPELQLGAPSTCTAPYPQCVGDFVHIVSYSATNGCAALGTVPTTVDVPIAAIDPDGLGMQLLAVPGFDPGSECFAAGSVGATVEVHAGTTTPGAWMVFEGLDALGRFPHGSQFVILGPRIDYAFPPAMGAPPPSPRDPVLSFTVAGDEPSTVGTFFSLTYDDRETVSGIRDTSFAGQGGFAGAILPYTSPRHTDPVFFTALTGSNSVLEAIPSLFGVANTANAIFFY